MKRKLLRYLFNSGMMLAAGLVQAAPISWSAVQTVTGNVTDVITTGTFVDSASAGLANTDLTVNGVRFNRDTTTTSGITSFSNGSNITVNLNGGGTSAATGGTAPSGWDASYRDLLYGAAISTQSMTISIGGLTVGSQYMVQIFETYWNANWPTSFSDGTNSSGYLNLGAGATAPQYVIGTFTADSATEAIYTTAANTWSIFSSMQVRSLDAPPTVPEPGTLLLLGAAIAAGRWRVKAPRI